MGVLVIGALALEENLPLLQLKISTSDMNATSPIASIGVTGGCVIISRIWYGVSSWIPRGHCGTDNI